MKSNTKHRDDSNSGGRRRALPAVRKKKSSQEVSEVATAEALPLLINGVLSFLLGAGFSRPRLARELRAAATLAESKKPVPKSRPANYRTMTKVCGVVRDWCWEPEYFDKATGEPKPLRLDDDKNDLRRLISKRFPAGSAEEILRWMEANGVVARQLDGTFSLIRRAVLVDEYHSLAVERMATIVSQYLETALHNLRTPESSRRHLDRTSWVFDLPAKHVPQFREVVRKQAQAFLEIIDEWLESRISPGSRESTVEAGVHAYMYVGYPEARTGRERDPTFIVKSGHRNRLKESRIRKGS